MRVMRRLFSVTLILSLGAALAAHAGEPGPASSKYQQGLVLLREKKPEAALKAFQESLEIQPSANTRMMIARCHRSQGRIGKAFQQLRRAAREAQDEFLSTRDRRLQLTQREAAREAEELDRRVPRLSLLLPDGLPDDVAVSLDDELVPRALLGAAQEVDPGEHRVLVTGARLKPLLMNRAVKEGEVLRVELSPERLPTATVALSLPVRPAGMVVTVDDQPLPPQRLDRRQYLDVGEHHVTVEAPGFVSFRWRQRLEDGDFARVQVKLHMTQGTPRAAFFAMAAGAVLGLGVGAGFGASAQHLEDSERMKNESQRTPSARSQVKQQALIANVSFVVGGCFAAAAGVLAFTTRWRTTQEEQGRRVKVEPMVGAGALGLQMRGGF